MSLLRSLMIVLAACFGLTAQAQTTVPGGQGFGAIARVLMDETGQRGTWGGAEVSLGMSQAVPFRVHTLDNPRRIVMDFRDVDFASVPFADLEAALVDGGRKRHCGRTQRRRGDESRFCMGGWHMRLESPVSKDGAIRKPVGPPWRVRLCVLHRRGELTSRGSEELRWRSQCGAMLGFAGSRKSAAAFSCASAYDVITTLVTAQRYA